MEVDRITAGYGKWENLHKNYGMKPLLSGVSLYLSAGERVGLIGVNGSGKTTLTNMLAKHYGWKKFLEPVDDNPYIDDYYKDISRWALNLEVFFLKQRFKNLLEIEKSKETIIQDRTIFEGVYVFATNNKNMGNMDERDYDTYMGLFDSMMKVIKMPELMVYLRASVPHLVKNIQKRGRDYEQQMPIDYLQGINNLYDEFIYKKYKGKVLVIEVDNLDFEHNPREFGEIVDRIDSQLFGLFSKEEES